VAISPTLIIAVRNSFLEFAGAWMNQRRAYGSNKRSSPMNSAASAANF
jgi:hypothetical protein